MFKFIHFILNLKFLQYSVIPLSSHKRKKFITVLKSPHINKTAQEQFEFRNYSCQLFLYSPRPLLVLIVLKRLFKSVFLGLKFELKVLLESSSFIEETLNPDCCIIQELNSPRFLGGCNSDAFIHEKKILKYIKFFDMFGEIKLQRMLQRVSV